MSHISLKTRLKLAWCAFLLKPHKSIQIKPYTFYANLRKDIGKIDCDTENCTGKAVVCMSPEEIEISINTSDYYHVCQSCANKVAGRYHRLGASIMDGGL